MYDKHTACRLSFFAMKELQEYSTGYRSLAAHFQHWDCTAAGVRGAQVHTIGL